MGRFPLEELKNLLEIELNENEIRELNGMEKRFIYKDLMEFLENPSYHRICALYGLRRTGKTIMMKQAMVELGLENCRLIEIPSNIKNIDMLDIYTLLKDYREQGIRYVFLDEITELDDFIQVSNLLADKYAGCMCIVAAGTDSYGLRMAADDALYDRVSFVHTTMIPFAEFSHIFKTNDIDEYIRYGGTMAPSQSKNCPFKEEREAKRYIQTAITDNIINSMEKSGRLDDYHSLSLLHYAGLLGPFINKNVELYCGNFKNSLAENISRKVNMLHKTKNNLLRRHNEDYEELIKRLPVSEINDIFLKEFSLDAEFGKFLIKHEHNHDIIEHTIRDCIHFFKDMDILHKISEMGFDMEDDKPDIYDLYYIIQPGMKSVLVQSMEEIIIEECRKYSDLTDSDIKIFTNEIKNSVYGEILENLVQFETSYFLDKERYEVFKVKFRDNYGEYDMIVRDKKTNEIDIYEIKHSHNFVPAQIKHLENKNYADKITAYYTKRAGYPATIKNKVLLYRGNTVRYKDIACLNTAEFFKMLAYPKEPYKTIQSRFIAAPRYNPNLTPSDNIESYIQQKAPENESDSIDNDLKNGETI